MRSTAWFHYMTSWSLNWSSYSFPLRNSHLWCTAWWVEHNGTYSNIYKNPSILCGPTHWNVWPTCSSPLAKTLWTMSRHYIVFSASFLTLACTTDDLCIVTKTFGDQYFLWKCIGSSRIHMSRHFSNLLQTPSKRLLKVKIRKNKYDYNNSTHKIMWCLCRYFLHSKPEPGENITEPTDTPDLVKLRLVNVYTKIKGQYQKTDFLIHLLKITRCDCNCHYCFWYGHWLHSCTTDNAHRPTCWS